MTPQSDSPTPEPQEKSGFNLWRFGSMAGPWVLSVAAIALSLGTMTVVAMPPGHVSPILDDLGLPQLTNVLFEENSSNKPQLAFNSNKDTAVGKRAIVGSASLIADVAEAVAPSVVNIDVERHTQVSASPFHNEMFRHFFGFDGQTSPFRSMPSQPQERVISGNGSGIIIDKEGHILTNNHVVATADTIYVTLQDDRKLEAQVIGRDPLTDLAIIKINQPPSDLRPAHLGDSERLRPGDWVLAIGSPLGFNHTVTLGIISAMSREIPDINSNVRFLQTDAAINPGNSGGPLVNLNGEVVGINTAIFGRAQNMGFAIPIDLAKSIATDLKNQGQIKRPWIGISMTQMTPELAQSLGLSKDTTGIVVARVVPQSPAERAGLQQGDVIQRIDGQSIAEPKKLQEIVREKDLNAKINLQILRDGTLMAKALTTETMPTEIPGMTVPGQQQQQPRIYRREFRFPN